MRFLDFVILVAFLAASVDFIVGDQEASKLSHV